MTYMLRKKASGINRILTSKVEIPLLDLHQGTLKALFGINHLLKKKKILMNSYMIIYEVYFFQMKLFKL